VSWAKLDDTLHAHPKATDAGLEAMGLWVLTLSHCGAYLTDGHVRRPIALRTAGSAEVLERLAANLVRVGLWELHPGGDGWQVHDYLEFNPSRLEVRAQRSATERRGREIRAARAREALDPVDLPALPPIEQLREDALRVLYAVALHPGEGGTARVGAAKGLLDATAATAQADSYGPPPSLEDLLGPDDETTPPDPDERLPQ
jgi:hypothetical protein